MLPEPSSQPTGHWTSLPSDPRAALPISSNLVPHAAPASKVTSDTEHPGIQIKVLHVINGEHFAGAARVQSHLGRCLPKLGIRTDFACLKQGKFSELTAIADPPWGDCVLTEMRHKLDLAPVKGISKRVRDEGYQLMHAHTPRSAMITALASKVTGIPWVYHVHSPATRETTQRFSNRINAAVERLSLRSCSHVITVSKSLRQEYLRRGIRSHKLSVVHNGVPMIQNDRAHHPVPGGSWVLGMVALMRPRKGLELALQAIASLSLDHDVKLRIIGPFESVSYEHSIQNLIHSLDITDQVECVGFSDNIPNELSKIDAMILPSLFGEGLPMVVLEAMAAGVPVIATRVEGTPEAVTDGVEGLLAEPGDSKSLTDRIDELLSGVHEWSTMSRAAARRHAADFSDAAMARGTAKVYRTVLQPDASMQKRDALPKTTLPESITPCPLGD